MSAQIDLRDEDVIVVIGSGAGGGTLSHELARRGHKVVCLEAGRHITRGEFVNDEVTMHEMLSWSDKRTGQATWMVKAVGGTTVNPSGFANPLATLATYLVPETPTETVKPCVAVFTASFS